MRKTIDRDIIVKEANNAIAYLADSGTKADADKREAIVTMTKQILLVSNSYKGFSYLQAPLKRYLDENEVESLKNGANPQGWVMVDEEGNMYTNVYDDSRIKFN